MGVVYAFNIMETSLTASSPGGVASGMRLRYAARRSVPPKNLAVLATVTRASGPAFTTPRRLDALSAKSYSDLSSIDACLFPSNPPAEKSGDERVSKRKSSSRCSRWVRRFRSTSDSLEPDAYRTFHPPAPPSPPCRQCSHSWAQEPSTTCQQTMRRPSWSNSGVDCTGLRCYVVLYVTVFLRSAFWGVGPLVPLAPLSVPLYLLDESCFEHLFKEVSGSAVSPSNGLDDLVPTALVRIRATSMMLLAVLEG